MKAETKAKKSSTASQTFTYKAPTATSVMLAGDFTGWQSRAISMKSIGNGLWQTTVKLEPGTHHYRFIVDGQWHNDPECSVRVPNTFGEENCVREVSGSNQ